VEIAAKIEFRMDNQLTSSINIFGFIP